MQQSINVDSTNCIWVQIVPLPVWAFKSLQQHHSLWFTDKIVVFKNRKFQLEIPLILVLTYKRVGPFLNGPKHVALKHVLAAFLLHSYCRTGILQFITDDNFTLTLTIFRFRLCTLTWKDRLVQLDYCINVGH